MIKDESYYKSRLSSTHRPVQPNNLSHTQQPAAAPTAQQASPVEDNTELSFATHSAQSVNREIANTVETASTESGIIP